jgi:hypothetical protein
VRLIVALAVLAATSCGGSDSSPEEAAADLSRFTLAPGEVPDGLRPDQEATGPIGSLREVLPPSSDAPQLPPLAKEVRHGFAGGYDAVYRGDALSLTSTAIQFSEPEQAAGFLAFLREVQAETITPGASELLEAPTLGEGYGWHRVVPGGETSGCSWRREGLVLTLTLAGPLGSAPAERALELARSLNDRLAVG